MPNLGAATHFESPTIPTSAGPASQAFEPAGTGKIPGPLSALDRLFLDAYKERQAVVRSNTSPVIVADFDRLILYWHGMTESNRSTPPIYHVLKDVAHVPFGIYLLVAPCATTESQEGSEQSFFTFR
jgi:hypothetical protein